MISTDSFPSVDSIPVGHFLNFYGGLQSYYTGMARTEVKVTSGQDFVQPGGLQQFIAGPFSYSSLFLKVKWRMFRQQSKPYPERKYLSGSLIC
jgi:hypothetical protein